MHILQIVCTDAFAGTERHVLSASLALHGAGHEVTVIGGSEAGMRTPLIDGGVRWIAGHDVRSAIRAARHVRDVDVIATHLSAGDLAGALVARRLRAPVVSTRHLAQRRGRDPVRRAAMRLVGRRVAAQIAISHHVAASVEGASTVIHAGMPPMPQGPAARAHRVLLVQRLEREKDTELALRAWALLGADVADWSLEIAGDGAERARLEQVTRELGIAHSVRFLGSRTDAPELMRESAIFVATCPSEGYGLAVLEAMAGGTAVIAAAAGGHLETIGGVPDAVLFRAGAADELATRIGLLMADEPRRRQYGALGRAHQLAEFSLERQLARTIDIYRRAMTR